MAKRLRKSSLFNRDSADRSTKTAGMPPGSLVFTGRRHLEALNVSLSQYKADAFHCSFAADGIPSGQDAWEGGVSWYDVRGLHNVALIDELSKQHGMHPLVVEDVLHTRQRPKFEAYEEGIFMVARALEFDPERLEVSTQQVAIFTTGQAVLSFQEKGDDLFAAVRQRLENGRGRIRARGSDYLTYALLDAIVDHYFIMLDKIEDVLEELESEIVTEPRDDTKSKIHALRICTLALRKAVGPLREAINQFADSEHPVVKPETGIFLRDLYDHTIRVVEMTETSRDLLNGIHDLYMSEISFKMNNVMRMLTIISTIFIPLTFLAGIYGMNFDYMPELHWKYSYLTLWAVMVLMTLGLMYYFRRRQWL